MSANVDKLITSFEKHRKRPNAVFEENLAHLFDIKKPDGNWLCSEDKQLYKVQIESDGRVGYTTMKVAPISTIHPSKRAKSTSELSTNQAVISAPLSCDSEDSEEGSSSGDLWAVPGESPREHATHTPVN